jgi:hypothetical protein
MGESRIGRVDSELGPARHRSGMFDPRNDDWANDFSFLYLDG